MFANAKQEQKTKPAVQRKETETKTATLNRTGIPDTMKTRFENISGFSFDDVRVHYNSKKPMQLQALAYTQGNQVYVAPGQERHLAHELGHVVQQKQSRVRANTYMNSLPVNTDKALESEADRMHFNALQYSENTLPVIQKQKIKRDNQKALAEALTQLGLVPETANQIAIKIIREDIRAPIIIGGKRIYHASRGAEGKAGAGTAFFTMDGDDVEFVAVGAHDPEKTSRNRGNVPVYTLINRIDGFCGNQGSNTINLAISEKEVEEDEEEETPSKPLPSAKQVEKELWRQKKQALEKESSKRKQEEAWIDEFDRYEDRGLEYFPDNPSIRSDGHCFWDSLRQFGFSNEQLRAAADGILRFEGLVALNRDTLTRFFTRLAGLAQCNITFNLVNIPYGTTSTENQRATIEATAIPAATDARTINMAIFFIEGQGHYVPAGRWF